ncbi:uncharacterized protein J3D65DRAFT_422424 [Phyllosticta citribraziliensis]|uniref:Uncharacterized protein n=1 Tax=Phyllosticta citribraziliensis TaxID=989973 RepID=A0ABR1LHQ7_9PEZI
MRVQLMHGIRAWMRGLSLPECIYRSTNSDNCCRHLQILHDEPRPRYPTPGSYPHLSNLHVVRTASSQLSAPLNIPLVHRKPPLTYQMADAQPKLPPKQTPSFSPFPSFLVTSQVKLVRKHISPLASASTPQTSHQIHASHDAIAASTYENSFTTLRWQTGRQASSISSFGAAAGGSSSDSTPLELRQRSRQLGSEERRGGWFIAIARGFHPTSNPLTGASGEHGGNGWTLEYSRGGSGR